MYVGKTKIRKKKRLSFVCRNDIIPVVRHKKIPLRYWNFWFLKLVTLITTYPTTQKLTDIGRTIVQLSNTENDRFVTNMSFRTIFIFATPTPEPCPEGIEFNFQSISIFNRPSKSVEPSPISVVFVLFFVPLCR